MLSIGAHSYLPTVEIRRDWSRSSSFRTRSAISQPWTVRDGESKGSVPPPDVKSITSVSNPFVKHCVKLRQSSSYRRLHGSALVVGSTPIREIWQYDVSSNEGSKLIECLIVVDGAEAAHRLNVVFPIRTIGVSSAVMKKLSGLQSIESVDAIALMKLPSSFVDLSNGPMEEDWFQCWNRVLVLEGIQDPGNLGTLLRSAIAFKWSGVFLLDGCCDPFNEKALRASRGASFQIPIVCGKWVHLDTLKKTRQVKLLAAHPHRTDPSSKSSFTLSQSLAESLSNKPLFLVLGSEGGGISEKSKTTCELVSIPMAAHFESLNVAVAGGIFMFMLQGDVQQSE